jgi:hypothetical protein
MRNAVRREGHRRRGSLRTELRARSPKVAKRVHAAYRQACLESGLTTRCWHGVRLEDVGEQEIPGVRSRLACLKPRKPLNPENLPVATTREKGSPRRSHLRMRSGSRTHRSGALRQGSAPRRYYPPTWAQTTDSTRFATIQRA